MYSKQTRLLGIAISHQRHPGGNVGDNRSPNITGLFDRRVATIVSGSYDKVPSGLYGTLRISCIGDTRESHGRNAKNDKDLDACQAR